MHWFVLCIFLEVPHFLTGRARYLKSNVMRVASNSYYVYLSWHSNFSLFTIMSSNFIGCMCTHNDIYLSIFNYNFVVHNIKFWKLCFQFLYISQVNLNKTWLVGNILLIISMRVSPYSCLVLLWCLRWRWNKTFAK